MEGRLKRTKGLYQAIEIWKNGIGNVPVKEITPQRIERFLSQRMEQEGISAATRNRHLAMLSSLFNKRFTGEEASNSALPDYLEAGMDEPTEHTRAILPPIFVPGALTGGKTLVPWLEG